MYYSGTKTVSKQILQIFESGSAVPSFPAAEGLRRLIGHWCLFRCYRGPSKFFNGKQTIHVDRYRKPWKNLLTYRGNIYHESVKGHPAEEFLKQTLVDRNGDAFTIDSLS